MDDFELLMLHLKQHFYHTLVKGVLQRLAKERGIRYAEAADWFRDGDTGITADFWKIVEAGHPGRFSGVYYCHGCKKFALVEPVSV